MPLELYNGPVELNDAAKTLLAKKLFPTGATSAQLKALDAAFRRQSLFSAQTVVEDLLAKYKEVLASLLNPETVQRPDRVTAENPSGNVTVGLHHTKAREVIQQFLKQQGLTAAPGTKGSLADITSSPRINLVIKTNSELAWGAGQFVSQNANPVRVQDYPALELYRLQAKRVPRDWQTRWLNAARECGDTDAANALDKHERMIALKSSPIWQALGDGAGGYDDTLGNPYPPFAFQSGMWTRDIDRATALRVGVLEEGEEAKPAAFDLAALFKEAA